MDFGVLWQFQFVADWSFNLTNKKWSDLNRVKLFAWFACFKVFYKKVDLSPFLS